MLPRCQTLGPRRRPRSPRNHDVQNDPTGVIVDRDRHNFDRARSSARLDDQLLAWDGPALANEARGRTALVAHEVATLILAAQKIPALPSDGFLS